MGREVRKKSEKSGPKTRLKKKKKKLRFGEKNPLGRKKGKEKKTPVINPRTDLHDPSA